MAARRDSRGRLTAGPGGGRGGGGGRRDPQISQITGELQRLVERLVVKITLDCVANLVEATPVDTGWARANWVPSVGSPRDQAVGTRDSFSAGEQQSGISQVQGFTLQSGRVFISNNVPYILVLNDGHSRQAPRGFIQNAIDKALQQDIRELGT